MYILWWWDLSGGAPPSVIVKSEPPLTTQYSQTNYLTRLLTPKGSADIYIYIFSNLAQRESSETIIEPPAPASPPRLEIDFSYPSRRLALFLLQTSSSPPPAAKSDRKVSILRGPSVNFQFLPLCFTVVF